MGQMWTPAGSNSAQRLEVSHAQDGETAPEIPTRAILMDAGRKIYNGPKSISMADRDNGAVRSVRAVQATPLL